MIFSGKKYDQFWFPFRRKKKKTGRKGGARWIEGWATGLKGKGALIIGE